MVILGPVGGGDSRIKMTRVLVVLVPFRVLSFKASSVVVFVVPVTVEIMKRFMTVLSKAFVTFIWEYPPPPPLGIGVPLWIDCGNFWTTFLTTF